MANTTDEDHRGIGIGARTYDIWIVDNEVWHCSADGIGANSGYGYPNDWIHHVYVGRNVIHHNKQGGFWNKESRDIIISQNVIYGIRQSPSSAGQAIGCQYGPERVWILYNEVYDCERGIITPDATSIYVIGNVIHDIHRASGALEPENPYGPGWAIQIRGTGFAHVAANTIYDVDTGISIINTLSHIDNNIVANKTSPLGRHIFLLYGDMSSLMNNNLLEGSVRISWGSPSPVYDLQGFVAATGQGPECINADPAFVSPAGNDFHLDANSPAIDAGALPDVYATYLDLYGVDIEVDCDGLGRPQNGTHDIGAYEHP